MIVEINLSAVRQTHWYEYLIRFVLGGAMTIAAGLIASRYGAVVGGLFLAFPAILPGTVTLVEKHTRERKEKQGLRGTRRGKEAAALDAAGAALGSFGLAAFAVVGWLMIELRSVSVLCWRPQPGSSSQYRLGWSGDGCERRSKLIPRSSIASQSQRRPVTCQCRVAITSSTALPKLHLKRTSAAFGAMPEKGH